MTEMWDKRYSNSDYAYGINPNEFFKDTLNEYQLNGKILLPYDIAALIFAHFPPNVLSNYHKQIADLIADEGIIILEGFSKSHLPLRNINPKVGGPNKIEMLFSTESIKNDFPDFDIVKLEEVEVELNEGDFHNGLGKVIRFIGNKIKTAYNTVYEA